MSRLHPWYLGLTNLFSAEVDLNPLPSLPKGRGKGFVGFEVGSRLQQALRFYLQVLIYDFRGQSAGKKFHGERALFPHAAQ